MSVPCAKSWGNILGPQFVNSKVCNKVCYNKVCSTKWSKFVNEQISQSAMNFLITHTHTVYIAYRVGSRNGQFGRCRNVYEILPKNNAVPVYFRLIQKQQLSSRCAIDSTWNYVLGNVGKYFLKDHIAWEFFSESLIVRHIQIRKQVGRPL